MYTVKYGFPSKNIIVFFRTTDPKSICIVNALVFMTANFTMVTMVTKRVQTSVELHNYYWLLEASTY